METTKAKLETYLAVLEIYSESTVETACQNLIRRDSAFPPSAGEVRSECERIEIQKMPPVSRDKNLPPPDKRTDEEKAASRERVSRMYAEWKAQLPPAERPLAKALGGVLGVSANQEKSIGPVSLGEGLQSYFVGMIERNPPATREAPPAVIEIEDDAPLF